LTAPLAKIGFLSRGEAGIAPDYVRCLARQRWRRRFPGRCSEELCEDRAAARTFFPSESWIVVLDEIALPLPGEEIAPVAGDVLLASVRSPVDPPVVHTLAEFERASFPPGDRGVPRAESAPALAFRVSDVPPEPGETVGDYVRRLLSGDSVRSLPALFAAVVFDRPAGERPEVIRHFPHGILRLLDVGCGPGEASGAIRRTRPQVSVTGIERDPAAAALARTDLDRVIEGDALEALRGLAAAGERFDAFLFADVLEHLPDPIAALAFARELALPKATLVVSVPNVGHLSLVRDLVQGRFDPLPSGLADGGHLRWFTRGSLAEALDEAGWRTLSIESLPGSPPPDEGEFLRWASNFPEADRDALTTYQWVAVAQPQ